MTTGGKVLQFSSCVQFPQAFTRGHCKICLVSGLFLQEQHVFEPLQTSSNGGNIPDQKMVHKIIANAVQ